jgi:hypothetical protein
VAEGYEVASLDEMRNEQWPHWITIRDRFDIRAFGINGWNKGEGEDVIPTHKEGESGHEELYIVTSGHASFTLDGKEVDAPSGTAVFIRDPNVERGATAKIADTTVLSIGGWAGRAFEVSEWETKYLHGE